MDAYEGWRDYERDDEHWRDFERRCSEREEYLESIRIGYDDLCALRNARTYRFTQVEPKPEYL